MAETEEDRRAADEILKERRRARNRERYANATSEQRARMNGKADGYIKQKRYYARKKQELIDLKALLEKQAAELAELKKPKSATKGLHRKNP